MIPCENWKKELNLHLSSAILTLYFYAVMVFAKVHFSKLSASFLYLEFSYFRAFP